MHEHHVSDDKHEEGDELILFFSVGSIDLINIRLY